ncbi:hypothetical protein N7454_010252 [Penicillium verhagenii]|nr:hypothetical protein N7454_010252 [Penicillium verhagenii]
MSTMDCGIPKLPNNACFPAPIPTHIKNQESYSSAPSYDAMAIPDPIPSPRRWSPTYLPRRRSRQFPTLSFVPSPTLPRQETHETSTTSLSRRPASRGPPMISPFRSVRKMKEPFQLMLPTSPASCDGVPPFRPKSTRESKLPGGRTLRTWRSDQNLTSANMSAFGLLPSPPISESRAGSAEPDLSYFECKDEPKEMDNTHEELQVEPKLPELEDLSGPSQEMEDSDDEKINYKAYRPPGWEEESREQPQEQRWAEVTSVHEAHSNLIRHCEAHESKYTSKSHDGHLSPISSPLAPTSSLVPGSSPRPQRPRTATVSSEASWIPSNLAYCETWLKGVPFDPISGKDENIRESNRRKVQIVEQDPPMPKIDFIPGMKSLDEPLRFAVASKPKNKPRLVDIARQSSPMPPPPSLLPHPLPMTPDQRQEEVSAFSPDTPLDNPLDMSDSGYGTRESGYSLSNYEDSKDDDVYTDPGSLTSDSVTSTVVGERPGSAQGEREGSPQPEIRSGSVSPEGTPQRRHSPSRNPPSCEKAESDDATPWDDARHEWTVDDHQWTLDELEHSVKDFPRHMLRLTSPAILHVRKSDDRDFLRPFRTIFPGVTENLLDCLCAALIARNYLLSLSTIHRHKPSLLARNDIYGIDAIPTKAYSTLGIQLPSGSPGHIKDRVLSSRSSDLRREVERIIDNLLFAICGRSDETLKSAIEVLAQVLEVKAP